MKYFYYVVQESENGKNIAYVLRIAEGNNLVGYVRNNSKMQTLHPCKSRKEADEIAKYWNKSFVINETKKEW